MIDSRKTVHGSRPEPLRTPGGQPQDIETLKRRFEKLSHEKTAAETRLEGANRTLEELKQKAREAYGTDDLEELRAKLETMRRENLEKRAAYQRDLERIEEDLQKVDQRYREAREGGEEP